MSVQLSKPRRGGRPVVWAGPMLTALVIAIAGATVTTAHASSADTVVTTDSGAVRGTVVSGTFAFRGVPYAAAPTGDRRWRAPGATAAWQGVRDATTFGANCPQPVANNLFLPPGPMAEDCLFLNISTPTFATTAGRCWCGSTVVVGRKTQRATTTARSWLRTASWS